jgi:glutaredoxin 3
MEASETTTKHAATVYTKIPCGFCEAAKKLLAKFEVDFETIDLTSDVDAQRDLSARTGHMTMPQIFVGDEFIGGYQELVVAIKDDRIREALGISS